MREYILYVKETQAVNKALITPCFSLDQSFWNQQDGCRLHILGKSRSLALIFALRQQVQLMLASRLRLEILLSQIRLRLQEYLRELNRRLPDGQSFVFQQELQGQESGRGETLLGDSPLEEPQLDNSPRHSPPRHDLLKQDSHQQDLRLLDSPLREPCRPCDPLTSICSEVTTPTDSNQAELISTEFISTEPIPPELIPFDPFSLCAIQVQADKLAQALAGRSLLLEEIEYSTGLSQKTLLPTLQWLVLTELTDWQPGVMMQLHKSWWRHKILFTCQRCGTESADIQLMSCQSCEQACAYCPRCLTMGRSRCCTPYICMSTNQPSLPGQYPISVHHARSQSLLQPLSQPLSHSLSAPTAGAIPCCLLKWQGTFSPLQADAAQRALNFVKNVKIAKDTQAAKNSAFLIWAVCGAGKTELIFPAVNEVLMKGEKVLLATPRKDVVLELVPRLRHVFPEVSIRAAYGSSKEKWEEGQFVISTTHQTMRYFQAFQLVVVDEVDALPNIIKGIRLSIKQTKF